MKRCENLKAFTKKINKFIIKKCSINKKFFKMIIVQYYKHH